MLAVWLLSVSICLSYSGVIAAPKSRAGTSNSEGYSAAVFKRRTLLKPYLSKYDKMYTSRNNQNKGRLILSATLREQINDPFALLKWMEIENDFPPTPEIYKDRVAPTNNNRTLYNIYIDVLLLLLRKMHSWVSFLNSHGHNSLESIEYYLGYDKETVDLINISMTELFSRQRKKDINVDGLAQLFYYSCDVKNMTHEGDVVSVRDRFLYFLNKFKFCYTPDALEMEETTLVDDLKEYLRQIDERTNASFGVTISAMKMRIPVVPEHPPYNIFQNASNNLPLVLQLSMYVDWYSKVDDRSKVNAYHFKTLSVVATYVFGYVYNHFELLSKLRGYNPDEDDRSVIDCFKKFTSAYMSVFIDRYFEFKGEISQQLVDALFSVVHFLDPNDPQAPDVRDLTDEERRSLNKHAPPRFSMNSYLVNPKVGDEFDVNMWNVINRAVEKLIETFTEEDSDSWNSLLKIEYGEQLDKQTLIQHMVANNENAIDILDKFAREFTIDDELYEECGLNDT